MRAALRLQAPTVMNQLYRAPTIRWSGSVMRLSVPPLVTCTSVLSEGHEPGARAGEASSKCASKVVELVEHEAGEAALAGVLG